MIVCLLLPWTADHFRAEEPPCDKALVLAKKGMGLHNNLDHKALKDAMTCYLQAIDLCPDICVGTPQVCANLGHAYHQFGELEKAIRMYKRALEHHPDYGTPYYGLGQVYLDQNLLGFSLDAFLKAYKLDRNDTEARQSAARVFAMICDHYSKGRGDRAKVDQGQILARDNMENRMLMDKNFHEMNRRLFHCKEKSFRVEFVLHNITFEPGRAVLKPGAEEQIKIVGNILRDNPGMKIILEGHTDATPFGLRKEVALGVICSDNLCLSRSRAEAVKQFLVEHFTVIPSTIKVMAYGDSNPIDPSNTPEANALNRRVTLILDKETH